MNINSFFGRTELSTFYFYGNGVWKLYDKKPYVLSNKITYSVMPTKEQMNLYIVRSNYLFEDINTLKCTKFENGKEIKEKILINEDFKIIKLEE